MLRECRGQTSETYNRMTNIQQRFVTWKLYQNNKLDSWFSQSTNYILLQYLLSLLDTSDR